MPLHHNTRPTTMILSSASVDNIIFPSTSGGYGTKVDQASPVYGWKDLIGAVEIKGTGPVSPSYETYRSPIYQYRFSVDDVVQCEFHLPHDYVPGTHLFIHAHWSLTTAASAGSLTWSFYCSYAKGYQRGSFSDPATPVTVSHNAATTNVAQYAHVISEVQLSASTPGSGQLDSDDLETDGVIIASVKLSANTIATEPFLHYVDIHYQSNQIATKGRNYPFFS